MDKKSKIILILLVITLLSLSSYASLSRFSKGINKNGSIQTTELEYCQLNEIEALGECLIRNDSKQELSLALNTIDERTMGVDFSKVEPTNVFVPIITYKDIPNKTNNVYVAMTTGETFTYVVESKLIDQFDVNDNEIENITFNEDTGYYSYTNAITGDINDIVTTPTDMENDIYKYTCFSNTTTAQCTNIYLLTENAYIISGKYLFKQGYIYSQEVMDTTGTNAGLYKGKDDYTKSNDNYTYYYRGDVKNNWVKFGNSLWRVVRINGNGTIRLIYSGLESAPNHTGNNAQIGISSIGRVQTFATTTSDVTGLTNDLITTTYSSGSYGPTYVGYMYNPDRVVGTYPNNKELDSTNNLNIFPDFSNISSIENYYFFKNFNPQEDCFTGDGISDSGTCTLKCRKLGNDGDEGVDCVKSIWSDIATTEGNYSTTAPGAYPTTNPTQYVYTSEYKYTCWSHGEPVTKNNSDGTTSVYVSCPIVSEIVGVRNNQSPLSKVRYHGLFSLNADTSNANVRDSGIKLAVDTWYENNILNKKDSNNEYLENYLADSIFCNDRSSYYSSTFPLSPTGGSYIYNSYIRNVNNKAPSFKCPRTNDAFTLKTSGGVSSVEASGDGNNMLTYPIGLITIDETAFAGGRNGAMNNRYYLYTGSMFWTMTPTYFDVTTSFASTWCVGSTGYLMASTGNSRYGIRPVINLKSDILYKGGNGTESNPYIIEPNS